ncbi:2-phospho-L-lactate guanylyltransferase [Labrenzia sp. CE80]|uniref:2-phospho-L-lactate guanylyltransferase n=1 Tax=Labrenzia sp. CE80 TaxID=1788986 RepID=UPI00129BD73E|nr:2-phospho-L-lactate guanylyltransferase [Labrenzia sp. CE80]
MTIWALIPVKAFADAKSRLSGILTPEQRAKLAQAMFRDTLSATALAEGLDGIAVVTKDPEAAEITRLAGACVIDDQTQDLNDALTAGRMTLQNRLGAVDLIIIPADLPAVRASDIEELVKAHHAPTQIVLSPDHEGNGTNMLLTGGLTDFPYAFGPASYQRHISQAKDLGYEATTFERARISADLDNPSDIDEIWQHAPGEHTKQALEAFRLSSHWPLKEVS